MVTTMTRMTLMPNLPCAMPLPCGDDGSYNCKDAEDDGTDEISGNGFYAIRGDGAGIDGEAGELCHHMFDR